jgi:hypothetical protein
VIDADQGTSGDDRQRDGFQELATAVSLGHAGLILAYEASRLARNIADWYRLIELATLVGTLLADADGVYDPRAYNDRLLLGGLEVAPCLGGIRLFTSPFCAMNPNAVSTAQVQVADGTEAQAAVFRMPPAAGRHQVQHTVRTSAELAWPRRRCGDPVRVGRHWDALGLGWSTCKGFRTSAKLDGLSADTKTLLFLPVFGEPARALARLSDAHLFYIELSWP